MKGIFYGWWIVLATSLIHFWGAGTFFYSFTALFNPLVEEFGWSYAATSFAASLRSIESGIAAPLVGMASDRVGARRILLLGSILCGAGFVLFSRIQTLWNFYLIFIFLSIGSSLVFPVPGWTAANNWFVRKRGTAIGILSAAIGLGGMIIYAVNALIVAYGWRTAVILIGIIMWVIGIPCSLVVRSRPEPYGLFPDGDNISPSNPGTLNRVSVGRADEFSFTEAVKTKAYWGLALAVTSSSLSVHAVSVHVMPYLISVDYSREGASFVASMLVLASVAGRFGLGVLSNRMDSRVLLAFGTMLQAVGLCFLAGAKYSWMALAFVAVFGPAFGGVITLRLTLQSQYFGRRAFGTIQGSIIAIAMIGTISSPLLTGLCFDVLRDYRPAWLVMAGVNLAVVPLILKIKPPSQSL
ncbi:MAG: MFS transporter [Desulfobacteraceae bacterium]|nr:MAG: MFS transporter [Desulfobacteraceae bacterium]